MKILILGGTGMLGHKLAQTFQKSHDTFATVRPKELSMHCRSALDGVQVLHEVSAEDFESVERAVSDVSPNVVINCVGVVKQLAAAEDSIVSITINSLLPHRLARLCRNYGARFITLGTDCVFSGSVGSYRESDKPDPVDLYGKSKLLGEVDQSGCLTIRTSMVGRQLAGTHGLVEWFLNQNGKTIKGYKKAIFSGFTTNALADTIASIVENHPELHGIRQVAAKPISKFELLELIKDAYGMDVEITPDETFVCNRSLNDVTFRRETGTSCPPWADMIRQMKQDLTTYPTSQSLKC